MIDKVALRIKPTGEIVTRGKYDRHHDLLQLRDENCNFLFAKYLDSEKEQGFVTDEGRFVGRSEGADIAYKCGQISNPKRQLYSEDLF